MESSGKWLKFLGENGFLRRRKDVRLAMEQVNKRLESYYHNERFPILLAGAQRLQDEFRKACTYINILDQGIVGYFDDLEITSIVKMANQMMERVFAGVDDLVIVNFLKAKSNGLTSLLQKTFKKLQWRQLGIF